MSYVMPPLPVYHDHGREVFQVGICWGNGSGLVTSNREKTRAHRSARRQRASANSRTAFLRRSSARVNNLLHPLTLFPSCRLDEWLQFLH